MPDTSENSARPPKIGTAVAAGPEIVLGTLTGLDDLGSPLIDWPGNPAGRPLPALATAAYGAADIGRAVALLFADGDPLRPLVVGLVRRPLDAVLQVMADEAGTGPGIFEPDAEVANAPAPEVARPLEACVDGNRVVITADREIVLQCGKASITLTRAGKILLRGAYLLSRSSGVNRIKGGSVQIN